ncbi:polyamine aminopropyltransferase [Thalassomonas actiniarum]|uniref:Polyamine aminopropyltransferase n=1 Tax=Thalassomonas actiniarum TaxID=485447 RepID=A0AAF0C442_9GAMM|nr:polyamine aminopropyltransferase [Thalassomonas actiniarum]WDE00238.1 polyamine aminopropyltransferase [Thalassomonas actiniarum]
MNEVNSLSSAQASHSKTGSHYLDDVLLILTMAVLAGCGLIYEYLLSHYAGRVLGIMESAIYTMIGLMIVSMGLGAFAARKIACAFKGFVWLEITIALLGSSAIIIISAFIGATQILPQLVSDTFALPPDALPRGGFFKDLSFIAFNSPYFFGVLLGFFIGMEIPLIARIREEIHQKHLKNNLGTIYGADYIGAGIGAAIWVIFLLSIDISEAAALTAALNVLAGGCFIMRYWQKLNWRKTLVALHLALVVMLAVIYQHGNSWLNQMNNLLYLDQVVYSEKTRYQQLTFTQRHMGLEQGDIINFYLNGRLQFSSSDEFIYHGYLVTPVLAASARQENILIIGGGDGLALRDILKWSPENVTLLDLDSQLLELFKQPQQHLPKALAQKVANLNELSLQDPRVEIIQSDAFIAIDNLLSQGKVYDAIIVDLPDPSHPDLNKLYSVNFYARLKQLLAGDGIIGIQSTSPYHAKKSFISIGKTLSAAHFPQVQQYHDNVPSFGEWGWTIAAKMGASPLARLEQQDQLTVPHHWLSLAMIKSAFVFPKDFYLESEQVDVNYLGSHTLYQLHQNAWRDQQGLNEAHLQK